jgi:hypothetical protein
VSIRKAVATDPTCVITVSESAVAQGVRCHVHMNVKTAATRGFVHALNTWLR